MDSPSAPAAPDPIVTANAQGVENRLTANQTANLNRPDQYTPYGSQTWTQTGPGRTFDQAGYDAAMAAYQAGSGGTSSTYAPAPEVVEGISSQERGGYHSGVWYSGADGAGGAGGAGGSMVAPDRESFYRGSDADARWTSKITLDPRVQSILDAQLATSQGLETSIQGALGRVQDTLKAPIDYAGLPKAGNYDEALATAKGNYTDISGNVAQAASGALSAQQLAQQQIERLKALYGTEFNYDSLGAAPQADSATRKRVEDAYFARERTRLDPRFAQEENRLRTDLMNRGVTEGSQAWGAQNENFSRGKNDAYALAGDNAILKGGEEMQRLFQLELAKRQQSISEMDKLRALPTAEAAAAATLAGGATSGLASMAGAEAGQNAGIVRDAGTEMQMRDSQRGLNLAEQERKRALVLNELASLRSGAQVNMPQFASGASGASTVPAPYAQSAFNAYQGQMGAYNGEVASNNSTMGAMAGLAGAALATPAVSGAIAAALPALAAF